MNYLYELECSGNKHIAFDDIIDHKGDCVLNILCYAVETQCKYPFLQFMMEKIPFCNHIVEEQITLPYVFVRNATKDIEDVVLERVMSSLDVIGCDYEGVTDHMYKGVICSADKSAVFALVDITGINVAKIHLARHTTCWFALPSEIINTKSICNIPIDPNITQLFTEKPMYGCLLNPTTKQPYMLPDAVYTGGNFKEAELRAIFGHRMEKRYSACGSYYFFHRTFEDAVNYGRDPKNKNKNYDNDTAVNRYALFVEGKMYLEPKDELGLDDDAIASVYAEPCVLICYTGIKSSLPDMLVKEQESFVGLTYHKMSKTWLQETVNEDGGVYMIA